MTRAQRAFMPPKRSTSSSPTGEEVQSTVSNLLSSASSSLTSILPGAKKEDTSGDKGRGEEEATVGHNGGKEKSGGVMSSFMNLGAKIAIPHHTTLGERKHEILITGLITSTENKSPPWLTKVLAKFGPLFSALAKFLALVSPPVIHAIQKLYALYVRLPTNVARAVYGLALCFFGGSFSITIAACEAFKQTGGEKTHACIEDLKKALRMVILDLKKDEEIDADHDGGCFVCG